MRANYKQPLVNAILVKREENQYFKFRNIALPFLLNNKDLEILQYLLKHDAFTLSRDDVESFIQWTIIDGWLPGLKAFLNSNAVHFYYQTLSIEGA